MSNGTILVVDDDEVLREVLKVFLEEEGFSVETASDGKDALVLAEKERFDVVVSDIHMAKIGGLELLQRLRELDPEILVVLMTAYSTVESAVTALRGGAYDYFTKPFNEDEVKSTVRNAVRLRQLSRENIQLRQALQERYDFEHIIGRGDSMMHMFSLIRKVSRTAANVLITGASGTGKEMVARAIHFNGIRKANAFVTVNCSAIPESLFESQMFGHAKGAFTGAIAHHVGFFEEANGGTLFLDEIGELSPFAQAKLLRAIQEGEIRPVGGSKNFKVDVRLISATNKELAEEVAKKRFREDLFYRLNVVNLKLPRLAERREDIAPLAYHFLAECNAKFKGRVQKISRDAMSLLLGYSWPGNVRQLENVIERAVVLAEGSSIEVEDLPEDLRMEIKTQMVDLSSGPVNLDALLENYEKQLIEQALQRFGGNISKAAELLGVHRRTLSSRVQRYGLKGGETDEAEDDVYRS